MQRHMTSTLRVIIDGAGAFGVAGIVVITLALAADVFARSALNKPLPAIAELVELVIPISWALLLAGTQAAGGNVKIVFFTERLTPTAKAALETFISLVALGLFAAMTYQAGVVAWESVLSREYVWAEIEYPAYPTRIALCLGCFLLCLQLLKEAVQSARRITSNP